MSQGTSASEARSPAPGSPQDPVFSTTIRGGIPPLAVEPRPKTGPNPAPERPLVDLPVASSRADPDLDLDVLPSLTPPSPSPADSLSSFPPLGGPLPSYTPVASAAPMSSFTPSAPSPIASAPVPAPPGEPAPSFQARPADEFMQAFLGAAEPASDSGGDDDLFASPPPPPPPPWPIIGAVAAVVVMLVLYVGRDSLFGGDDGTDAAADTTADVAAETKAPEVKAEPPPETKLAEAKAEPKLPTPPPAPTDPAFVERLAKAKAAYSDGKLKATAAALAELSKQAPEHPEVLLLTAQVQLEEGKIAESRTTANKCVALDPNLADCWLTLGVLRQHGKDDAGAVIAYETYLKLAPSGRYARDANSQLARLRRSAG
ncbi:hypothetical protein [Nannocystis sp. SCPEA4]|uniref:tetratricopeptide repeat protein n=1 Tax=Nannocystis sp. SCPEA4 TaxID=2996787 RepID=UPI00226DEB22|nr:hypothetical protein [Nannocystis sp. SCPEA4]MCY1063055.1 hypothetical protein [Nannocystis sp. SCPEA4]